MGTISNLATLPAVDHATAIAEGLERMAADIRAGQLPIHPVRCIVALTSRSGNASDLAVTYLGADASPLELIGMCELAKDALLDVCE